MPKRPRYKPRKPLIWFDKRIGQFITKNCASDLFNHPIKIESIGQATALYLSQEKGHRYE